MVNQPIIGQSDFKSIREYNGYYVDKSMFINEIIKCPYQSVLIPRPRRFGKTLNLSMLRYFFEKSDENQIALFDGLEIKKYPIFQEHFGKYPVIFMTFKELKATNWEEQYSKLKHIILKEIVCHEYLLKWKELPSHIFGCFNRIISDKAQKDDYEESLEYLSYALFLYHKRQVVILIDEYDTPIHSGYYNDYYQDVVSFIRNFLSGGFKDNANLFKGVITGTLRISKESIFTGLNNLGVFTLLDQRFNECFGFSSEEVRAILSDFSFMEYYDEILKWYDGYNFGGKKILNPWSVINFVMNDDKIFKPYWLNTSSMEMIEEVVAPNKESLRKEIYDLLDDKTITKSVYENIVFNDIKDTGSDIVWSFLLHSGYLKVVKEIPGLYQSQFELQIPNMEVKIVYFEIIKKWIKSQVKSESFENMLKSLTDGDITLFEKYLKSTTMEIMSFHDFSDSPEKVYHALVLGMLVWLSNVYDIRSNRESGLGRYDIMFKPKRQGEQGIIIEFKKLDDKDNPEKILTKALNQIENKQYDIELKTAGVVNILKIAVVFKGKEVFLKSNKENKAKKEKNRKKTL